MFYNLFIINRYGGVVYSKALSTSAPNLSTNDCLRLGSTFHSLHAIATQVAPVQSGGIQRLETDTFVLQCLQTLTGVKFLVSASPGTFDLDGLLQGIYELYADYVLKNPFYEVDMPIRCDLFNRNLDRLTQKIASTTNKRRSL